MPARVVVDLLTLGGARVLGMQDRIGSLEPGKRADVVCLDVDQPHAVPIFDPYAHIAYAARASDVRHVVVEGRTVIRDSRVTTVDQDAVIGEVREISARVGKNR
jgi:5-methylthioadenosine/S-adenosylhomocysteine deaminase